MRTVTRWKDGERFQTQAEPTPFSPERAEAIYAQREPMGGSLDKFMTDGEVAFVLDIWDTMPGNTCWNDAFERIRSGVVRDMLAMAEAIKNAPPWTSEFVLKDCEVIREMLSKGRTAEEIAAKTGMSVERVKMRIGGLLS